MNSPGLSFKIKSARYGIFVLFFIFLFIFIFQFPRVSLPLLFSYIVSLFVSPIFSTIKKSDSSRRYLIIICILIATVVSAYSGLEFISRGYSQMVSVEYDWPKFEAYTKQKLENVHVGIEEQFGIKFEQKWIVNFFQWLKDDMNSVVVKIPVFLSNFLEWIFLVPFFSFYLIKDGDRLKNAFLKIVPNGIFESMYYLVFQFHQKFRGYFVAKLLEALAVGTLVYIGLEIIRYPFSFVLGVLAGVTNIVPYIGPVAGFAPALIVGMVMAVPKTHVWIMGAIFLGANILDVIFIFPALVSRVVNVHPAIVIIGVFVGSQLGGALGMLLSVPVISIIKLVIEEFFARILNGPGGAASFDEDL